MTTYSIGVTKSLATWNLQGSHVERMLDNAPYDAAHPDDTLILAGPARRSVARADSSTTSTIAALGMLTAFGIQSQAPVTPMMAIGSGRNYFLRGKSQSSWNMQRVLLNGKNLLRALYHNAVGVAGLNPDKFDDPAAIEGAPHSQFYINLDSELFYIPFGLALIMRTKSRTLISGCYLELCMITSWGMQVGAGQAMIMESVQGFCDRILPYQASDIMEVPRIGRNTMDAVLGLAENTFPAPSYNVVANFGDTGLNVGSVDGL